MATLGTKGFTTIVRDFAAGAQSRSTALLDFTIGSILRAVGDAVGGVSLWLQGMILALLQTTRAATSKVADLDTWMADCLVTRLTAIAATGLVTFSRTSTSIAAVIPVGAVVSTGDNSQSFTVYVDTTKGAYSATAGGYLLPIGSTSVQVPVAAVNSGVQGNAVIGAISVMKTGISGVDTVTNASGFTNGIDAESDQALRTRFWLYIQSWSKATEAAIGYAIVSLQQGLQYNILEFQDYGGATDYGMVTVIVDDGSGAISSPLVTACTIAVNAVRACGVRVGVYAATILSASTTMTITTAAGYDHPTVVAQVATALNNYINGLRLATTLRFTKLEQIAYDASPGVTNVSSVSLNSGTSDLVPTGVQTIKTLSTIVS